MIRSIIVARGLRDSPFRLVDLRFGAEDAERDDLLEESFVPRENFNRFLISAGRVP